MGLIQLQMDEVTWQQAQQVASQHNASVESLVKDIIMYLATKLDTPDPILGMFSQDPDLIDQIVLSAMHAREDTPLRLPGE